jgi:uncharacterized protein involved in exopolysaccharide biosynthesis
MGAGPVTATRPATGTAVRRWRTGSWVVLTVVVLAVIAGIGAYLTAPPGWIRNRPSPTGRTRW